MGKGGVSRTGWLRVGTAAATLAATVSLAAGALATPASPTPWTGKNPYHCQIQNAGFGTTVPHPNADPYCVYFNKTRQNITQLGMVQFLTKEPARAAAAVPKCFYFQSDHWRGSVIQSNGETELWEWVGHYFFNKATGDGGAWVEGFSLNGRTYDPTTLPGFPAQYKQDFGPGTGGVITHDDVPVVAKCVAMANRHPHQVYANPKNPET